LPFPWILYGAWMAQALPPLAALRYGGKLPPARRWLVAWSVALFIWDGASLLLGLGRQKNLWLFYAVAPVVDCVMLWTLSLWQQHPVARLTYRSAIPIFIAVWAGLVVSIEQTDTFSMFAFPFEGVVLLVASLFTLLTRSLGEQEGVTSRDWFWAALGLSLYYAAGAALQPFARWLLAQQQSDLLRFAYETKAGVNIIAFVSIAIGMLCPLPPVHSGGFSSLRRSRSGSFSSRSAPPS
jgi:hypothetical protein